jgi:hypothetical protein
VSEGGEGDDGGRYNSTWQQLWLLNPPLVNPNVDLRPGMEVNVGRMYVVRNGDTLGSVTQRFGSTESLMAMLNFDVQVCPVSFCPSLWQQDAMLKPGQAVCVLPSSCVAQRM